MSTMPEVLDNLSAAPKRFVIGGITAAALAATAAWVAYRANRAERNDPQSGTFMDVDGTRLHYVDRGSGPVIVLLHGNALRLEDFVAAGMIDRLAKHHRVIAFDRPGFGHSDRPRMQLWTPDAQAELLQKALKRLGVSSAVIVGHSWGTLVAIALTLREQTAVRRLVLISGYYFPDARLDVLLAAPAAIPGIGEVLRYTVSAIFARVTLGRAIKAMFHPKPVPTDFLPVLSREMLVRPLQLRADAEDAGFMIPAARALSQRYTEITVPVVIFAGEDDKVVSPDKQARKLHARLDRSELRVIPGEGHMVHYGQLEQVIAAVE